MGNIIYLAKYNTMYYFIGRSGFNFDNAFFLVTVFSATAICRADHRYIHDNILINDSL